MPEIALKSCRKAYTYDTQRAVPPEETLARVSAALPAAGITRVADITNLDRIGIPVFSSIRPTADTGAVSVYNGKGATPAEARVSAMMEGIERYSAEILDRELLMAAHHDLIGRASAIFPGDLILPRNADPHQRIPWVAGYDLMSEEEIYVPAHSVFHPLPPEYPQLFRTNTNGLASGNTREEAVFHGLMEVIERDAWSLVEATRNTGPRVTGISTGIAADLLGKFAKADVEVHIKDISSDLGIPTIAAVSDDTLLQDPALLTIGMGSHTSASIALLRALTEVAQSRLTQIHGAREDTAEADIRKTIGYDRVKRMNRYWFAADGEVNFSTIPSFDSDDFLTDIRFTLDILRKSGIEHVIVVDLTRDEIGVPVVRVIVPGLEVYGMDQERVGGRCRHARNRGVSRAKL
jgi:putative methanogenesis marker protein 1